MTIRSRFTLLFTALVSLLLCFFCLAIYLEAGYHQQREFRERLRKEAITSATFLLNKDVITPEQFKVMTEKHITVLNDEELVILDLNGKPHYQSEATLIKDIDDEFISQIKINGEFFRKKDERDFFGITFVLNNQRHLVVISALDKYGISKQNNLRWMLTLGWLGITLFSLVVGWFLAGRFLSPINKIIQNIDKITGSDFSLRLSEGKQKDELEQLSMRFNQMLNRVQSAFDNQRAFVSHASHELRTPLTSITGQIQVSLLAKDKPKELKETMVSVLDDIQQLNKLTNDLLDLTSLKNHENTPQFELVNVVHLIWQAQSELQSKNPAFKIMFTHEDTNDLLPELYANESLLYTAIINLIGNALKFSEEQLAEISLESYEKQLILRIRNNGEPIPESEYELIFEPFRRGSNTSTSKGHGVGLPLVKQITELHHGKLSFSSSLAAGTTFTLTLPR